MTRPVPAWRAQAEAWFGELDDHEIARRLGIERHYVAAHRKRCGIDPVRGKGRPRKSFDDLEQEHPGLLALLATEGASGRDVGAFANRSASWGRGLLARWREAQDGGEA